MFTESNAFQRARCWYPVFTSGPCQASYFCTSPLCLQPLTFRHLSVWVRDITVWLWNTRPWYFGIHSARWLFTVRSLEIFIIIKTYVFYTCITGMIPPRHPQLDQTPPHVTLCSSQHCCFYLAFVDSAQANWWMSRKWLLVPSCNTEVFKMSPEVGLG